MALISPEDDAAIKNSFLTQSSVGKGDPPFSKLSMKYLGLKRQRSESNLYLFGREVAAVEFLGEKHQHVRRAIRREKQAFTEQERQIREQIEQVKKDIKGLKKGHVEALAEKEHMETCEALRRQVVVFPKRSKTQEMIEGEEAQIAKVKTQQLEVNNQAEVLRAKLLELSNFVNELEGGETSHNGDQELGELN